MVAKHRARAVRWLVPALLVIGWLALGGWLGPLGGKLGDVADSGAAGYLPTSSEAKTALELNKRFGEKEALPAAVVYTDVDRETITRDIETIKRDLREHLTADPIGPIISEDRRAAQVIVLFAGTDENKITPHVQKLRELITEGKVAGPAGVQADLQDALGAVDLMLVLVTAGVILLILILVYRSPLLPFIVLGVAGTALGVTQGIIYLLAKRDLINIGAEVQGILNVLVLGAATDYALLLIARYREELRGHPHRFDAMRAAMRGSIEPIVASAATVALGLACLLVSDLGLNRQLGPAGAIGIGCALIAMLTFLPGVLVLCGRVAFWPRRPLLGSAAKERTGAWSKVAGVVGRRPRIIWIGTALVLGGMALGVVKLHAEGLSHTDMIIASAVESKEGQRALERHYPAGSGNPVLVFVNSDRLNPALEAIRGVRNVRDAMPYVGAAPPSQTTDRPPPKIASGMARVDVTLDVSPDSKDAQRAVRDLRTELGVVPGADAKVGGYTAVKLDFDATARADRKVIPLLLVVVGLIVALLLRSLIAPILLLGTVVLSFFAAIGVSTLVFQNLLGYPGVDSTFPLHAFVFLVALGVDYNIFLMTRVREESARHGTRRGVKIGLAVTGGVITSAGVVLAATFAALAVIPLVLMVELAFTVAFGVLLDTFLVRTLLVPALAIDVGKRIWWPHRLASMPDDEPLEPRPPAPVSPTPWFAERPPASADAVAALGAVAVPGAAPGPNGGRHAAPPPWPVPETAPGRVPEAAPGQAAPGRVPETAPGAALGAPPPPRGPVHAVNQLPRRVPR